MMLVDLDDVIDLALENRLGHSAPFSEAERRNFTGPLYVYNARNLSGLSSCPNLMHLEIYNSDVQDLGFLAGLPKLETLKIYCTPIVNIQQIVSCDNIKRFDLCFTLVKDLSPVLQLPQLTSGIMLGNPWTVETRQEVIPELLNLVPKKQRQRAFMFSNETDWRNTLTLQEYGLKLCVSSLTLMDSSPVIVKPGIPVYTQRNCDFFSHQDYSINLFLHELAEDSEGITEAEVFEWVLQDHLEEKHELNFARLPEIGTAVDALNWVESSGIPAQQKESYRKFIEHFPYLTFCRGGAHIMGDLSDGLNSRFPEWFVLNLATLAYILPFQKVEILFFEQSLPFERLKTWHTLDFNKSLYSQFVKNKAAIYPVIIAGATHGFTSRLAIDFKSKNNTGVYSFDLESYVENEKLDEGLDEVFASYAELLAQIRVIKAEIMQNDYFVEAKLS